VIVNNSTNINNVQPILLYGSEIRGVSKNIDCLEKKRFSKLLFIDTKIYDLGRTGTISYRNLYKNKDGVILGQTFIGRRY
jgi:hypothetical protein